MPILSSRARILITFELQNRSIFDPEVRLVTKSRTSRSPVKNNGFWSILDDPTDQNSSKFIKSWVSKIDKFLVSILEVFLSLLGSKRVPNRAQNPSKTIPKVLGRLRNTRSLTDLVPKCSKKTPGAQKVIILKSKMTSQSSKIDPRTTPIPKKTPPNETRT